MILSLEALEAKYGDSLILYFGKKTKPGIIVIDGGPSGVYADVLKPRLLQLKKKLSPDKPLPLSMVMVSHMDDDHVNGILAMVSELKDKDENDEAADLSVSNMWFNSFDDLMGNLEIPSVSSIAASVSEADVSAIPGIDQLSEPLSAVIASTGQGRKLRAMSDALSFNVNNPFPKISPQKTNLVRSDLGGKKSVIPWPGNLKITVLHPNEQRLLELQKQWDKDLKKAKASGNISSFIASLENTDKSPFNLSSIVCLVEAGGKKILLTGDARSDDILQGLAQNKLLDKKGKLHVDVLKLPHHGSIRNAKADFYQAVTADHYVISANGKFDNPDKALLDLLEANLTKGTIHFTNQTGEKGLKKKLDAFEARLKKNKSKVKLDYRKDKKPSVVIDLLDKLPF